MNDTQHAAITVIAVLEYEGKQYTVTREEEFYDFYEDADDHKNSLYYMWEEGNFSCDCNRSQFIREQHDEDFPDLSCGHTITLVSLTFVGEAE